MREDVDAMHVKVTAHIQTIRAGLPNNLLKVRCMCGSRGDDWGR